MLYRRILSVPIAVLVQGEAERKIVRVTVDCSLQEQVYNPYYHLVLGRLTDASKSHRVTLQYCLWDQIKQVSCVFLFP